MAHSPSPDVHTLLQLLGRIPTPPWTVDTSGVVPVLRDAHGAPVESLGHSQAAMAAMELMALAPQLARWVADAFLAADHWATTSDSSTPVLRRDDTPLPHREGTPVYLGTPGEDSH